ncbi:MAG TPA: hypothetical protein PKL99_11330 [Syntrophales bacterium]|nr:hypothetical protein [Syntrophales bacterium]
MERTETRKKTPPWRIVLLVVLVLQGCASTGTLKPFRSDGCSLFPDGTPENRDLWLSCCVEHDKAYWRGGTREERLAADEALEACVAACGEPAVAALMKKGVRLGGLPYWPTWFRWGYGWDYPRGYRALTPEEKERAYELIEAYERSRKSPPGQPGGP